MAFLLMKEYYIQMRCGISLVLPLLLAGAPLTFGQNDPNRHKQDTFYDQAKRSVVRLSHLVPEKLASEEERRAGKGDKYRTLADGTGFFVRRGEDLFLVTAAHVARLPYDLQAQVTASVPFSEPGCVQCFRETTGFYLQLPRSRWIVHPDPGDATRQQVDVAVMKIPELGGTFSQVKGATITALNYCPAACLPGVAEQLPLIDARPPDTVIVFGYPGSIGIELHTQLPLGRHGMIAFATDEDYLKIDSKYVDNRTFWVDMTIQPGNSGSPVLRLTPGGVFLVGMIFAVLDTSNIGVAESVSRIRETLDAAKNQKIDFQPWHWMGLFPPKKRP